MTMLPATVRAALDKHLATSKLQHTSDLAQGVGRVVLPFRAWIGKYPQPVVRTGVGSCVSGGARVSGRALGAAVSVSFA